MTVFGRSVWLYQGEVFSLVFGIFAKFSPTKIGVRNNTVCDSCKTVCNSGSSSQCLDCHECFGKVDKKYRTISLRQYVSGLLIRRVPTSDSMVFFVILILSSVTFDGFMATPLWVQMHNNMLGILPNSTIVTTVGMIAFFFILLEIYRGTTRAIQKVSKHTDINLFMLFAFSMVPIALGYHLAHYFSYLIIQGQLILPLLSDPLGNGWNLFNTSNFQVNIGIIGATFTWVFAIATIVIGHVYAMYISHIIALRTYKTTKDVMMNQYPLVLLMIGYTAISLWIVAQPIVET